MFERLGDRLDGALKKLRQRGVITEKMLDQGLREVRRALLEADVNFRVVRDFLAKVKERALGEDVLKSVRPGDQIVKIVHDELVALLGEAAPEESEASVPPTVIMLVGLQGSGKTTTAAKLGRRLATEGRRPALVACDPYRPAAPEQLEALAARIGVPLLARPSGEDMSELARGALDEARRSGVTHLLLDMAGRLQADEELLDELRRVKAAVEPQQVLLVADGMTGQEAVRIAEGFHGAVGLTGIVLTKMDGDARGARRSRSTACSACRSDTSERRAARGPHGLRPGAHGRPDPPDGGHCRPRGARAADGRPRRDRAVAEKDAGGEGEFDLADFLTSIQQIQKMGPLKGLLKMMPGIDARMLDQADVDPRGCGTWRRSSSR